MSRLEVQYAVRVGGPGGYIEECESRSEADRLAECSPITREVVAQVVMVAVDWTDPDTAEGVVRDEQDRARLLRVVWLLGFWLWAYLADRVARPEHPTTLRDAALAWTVDR